MSRVIDMGLLEKGSILARPRPMEETGSIRDDIHFQPYLSIASLFRGELEFAYQDNSS